MVAVEARLSSPLSLRAMEDVPIEVADIEMDAALPSVLPPEQPGRWRRVMALVRVHSHPVGTILLEAGPEGLTTTQVAGRVEADLGAAITAHLRRDGVDALGVPGTRHPRCLERRARALETAPLVSVVVATRDRTKSLARCLDSVLATDYPKFEIVVVDNDPTSSATAALIESRYEDQGVRYVREDRRGLASAHNRGLETAAGSILAFTDDDVVVDRDWLAAIVEAFHFADDVGAVTGLIQPGELRTGAQMLLERHGSFSKGFTPRIFDLKCHRPADRRFPLAVGQCGSGANMAFEAECLRRIGGFDPALGTGTAARGGDDLAAFFHLLVSGRQLVYQPAAVVRHWHRDNEAALAAQAYGYGTGLAAYLTDAVIRHPGVAIPTVIRATGLRVGSGRPSNFSHQERSDGLPPELRQLGRRGAMTGPFSYLASRWHARGAKRPA
jgi:glycosyltransferase involved in cell wall biosynthesis